MAAHDEIPNRFLTLENRHTGEILRMRRVRGGDGHTVLILEGSLPPRRTGPPLHTHVGSHEHIVVKAGALGVPMEQETLEVPVGKAVSIPAGVRHTWWNAGDDALEVSGRSVPAGDLDRFIQAIFAVANASRSERPSMFYIAHVLWRHRRTQRLALPPRAIQRVVFPVILLLGHILGKYRGSEWPGSPASCVGAPETDARARIAVAG
jgi:quercetin dioxygenase-like cupin family protein